jgi:hypothetical protein
MVNTLSLSLPLFMVVALNQQDILSGVLADGTYRLEALRFINFLSASINR